MIVVDASLALKWYLDEPFSDEAEDVLTAHSGSVAAPDILLAEVIGALVRRANIDKSLRLESDRSIRNFLTLFGGAVIGVEHLSPAHFARAATLALDLGHPLKDCLYLELAMRLDAPLLTFDIKFAEKARTLWPRIEIPA